MMPTVSVIMPLYNSAKHLREAVDSMIAQTLVDWELIAICEPDSHDTTNSIMEKYAVTDNRIRVIYNTTRLGISASLNRAIRESHGMYIARMDGDDVSLPTRLESQVRFMNEHPDVAICASHVRYIDVKGKTLFYKDNLSDDSQQLHSDLLFFCFIHHPSVAFRKSSILEYNLYYDETYTEAEDYELWCRASRIVQIAATPDVLFHYRWRNDNSYHTGMEELKRANIEILRSNLKALDVNVPDEVLHHLCRVTCHETIRDFRNIEKRLNMVYNRIVEKNRELNVYKEDCLIMTLDKRMYWRRHKIRRIVAVLLKSFAKTMSEESFFYATLYLELNGFYPVFRRVLHHLHIL